MNAPRFPELDFDLPAPKPAAKPRPKQREPGPKRLYEDELPPSASRTSPTYGIAAQRQEMLGEDRSEALFDPTLDVWARVDSNDYRNGFTFGAGVLDKRIAVRATRMTIESMSREELYTVLLRRISQQLAEAFVEAFKGKR